MYWLRRVPTETRIVVVVVFLALFQAILLSVFGLTAIYTERAAAEGRLRANAINFLRLRVVHRAEAELRERAQQACAAAFDRQEPDWRLRATGLFTDAYLLERDGTIRSPFGGPLYRPPAFLASDDERAQKEADAIVEQYIKFYIPETEAEKAELDLKLAQKYPFARAADDREESLALLFAASPLFVRDAKPTKERALQVRWIGVLNRVAGHIAAESVLDYLNRVDRVGASIPGFAEAVAAQEAGPARSLEAVLIEAPDLRRESRSILHQNHVADPQQPFYVRSLGADAPVQVLAIDRGRLHEMLAGVVRGVSEDAADTGLATLEIVEGTASGSTVPSEKLVDLPGYVAVATISEEALRGEAGRRERSYWYIIAFSVAGILAGGFLTARVVMRELRLAKLKSGFVSNVSHELKTPLTSIRMFTEMLRSGQVTDETERQECLKVISTESERLVRLIQRVLDFGRLDARKHRFQWTTGPLDGLVRREVERFLGTTGLDKSRFLLRIAPDQPHVRHDPEAFAEVISSLLSNAYKYSPPDDRRLAVMLARQRGRLLLTVEDNGPGIPPRERTKIFEQFYRSNDYLSREVEGTGLGLSIVRSIVHAHGGRVLVEEPSEGGSRFVVALPLTAKTRAMEPAEVAP